MCRPTVPLQIGSFSEDLLAVVDSGSPISVADAQPFKWLGVELTTGFITWAAIIGSSDRAIAVQTNHRSLASIDPDEAGEWDRGGLMNGPATRRHRDRRNSTSRRPSCAISLICTTVLGWSWTFGHRP